MVKIQRQAKNIFNVAPSPTRKCNFAAEKE